MSKFLSRFKGEKEKRDDLTPASSQPLSSNNPYRYTQTEPPAYEPPPGPPPSHSDSSKLTHSEKQLDKSDDNPPPYHDWTSIPDTALFPPPPALANDYSTTSNATYDEAAIAHAWCAHNYVYNPTVPNVHLVEAVQAGQHDIDPPPGFRGSIIKATPTSHPSSFYPNSYGAVPTTVFHLSSTPTISSSSTASSNHQAKSPFSYFTKATPPVPNALIDQTHITRLPLYFASTYSPFSPHFANAKPTPYTIYFEIRPTKFLTPESTVSIGFASKPYPPNRQPGWHRASLAVHSDDGNRYVNDPWGGREFTSPFQAGEILGLAVQIRPEEPSVATEADKGKKQATLQSEREVLSRLPKCKTKVFFTRNGVVQGSWDIDEERDAEKDEGIAGLLGEADLYAAVGTYGSVEVEIRFYAQGDGFVAPPSIC